MTSPYAAFPVLETIHLAELSEIRSAVDRMADAYSSHMQGSSFSYRILLPRGDRLTNKAKRIGVSFQGEFLLALRKKGLVPRVREVRYLHDEAHYGWILADPSVFEQFERGKD